MYWINRYASINNYQEKKNEGISHGLRRRICFQTSMIFERIFGHVAAG